MALLLLLLYGIPIYLVFFKYKVIPFTAFWKIFIWIPPVFAGVFLWFALGRYTPIAQDAYVQAPVVQIAPEVGGAVTEVFVKDNQEVKRGTPLFQVDQRSYRYGVDQANAKVIEVQENVTALLASVYAAEETIGKADAGLVVTQRNVTGAQKDLEAAQKSAIEVKKQLALAESDVNRNALLLAKGAGSQRDYDASLRNAAAQRAQSIEAQNRVSRAEITLEIAASQVTAAEAAVREARAMRGKAEVMVDPAKTLRRAIDTKQAELNTLLEKQPGTSSTPARSPQRISDLRLEIDRMREYLKKGESIEPFLRGEHPTTRQAKEALSDAALSLERTTVKAPVDGLVSNLQLTQGTYIRAGTPVVTVIDTTQWRLVAAVPENWLEKVRPGDEVIYSLRNYPGRVLKGKVETVGRGVVQGQGVPGGNLPDTDPRRMRQTDTPQSGQEFQVVVLLQDDQPDQPLRVGATGRMTVFASGGFPVVSGLATILHTIFSVLDYLHPKPPPLVVLLAVASVIGLVVYLRHRPPRAPSTAI